MHLLGKLLTTYFVLQSLHKALPSTTLYYRACAKHFPVLLCTTKLAQSTSQYYFVLQSLRKALPSTTLHYKACTKHVPELLCTTKLTQNIFHLVTFHYRSLDAATPLRFTISSCKKGISITHAAMVPSNFDAAITVRSAETEVPNTIELRKGVKNCSSETGSPHQSRKTTILKHFLKCLLKGKQHQCQN